jgi:exoribonuclease R
VLAWLAGIREAHGVPATFDPAVVAEAERAAADAGPAGERRDLTDLPFVTLDPPGSTDLDQAMHLERRGEGYRVRYAIADVAAVVRPGGAVDREAHARATTVYCPDLRVPLHPPVLSEGAASLLPGQVRRAVVWTIDLDAAGEVVGAAPERATVRSVAQLDYRTEQARRDRGQDFGPLALLAEIGELRRGVEARRGGVSLGRPEQEVVPAPGGWQLVLRAPLPVEEDNAQVSLLTGTVAAGLMLQAGVGVLRTMPAADDAALRGLRRQASALGIAWPDGATYGDVLRSLERTTPAGAAFLVSATRLFRGAAWTPFDDGQVPADPVHGAVGAPYAHVTAPLRRLVDRYGTEICLAVATGRPVPDWVRSALPSLGATMAAGAARAASVDRESTDLVEAVVLAGRVGETFTGVAIDDRTVQLTAPAVVARLENTADDGHEVQVVLTVADPPTRTVRFAAQAGGRPAGAP